MVIKVVWRGVCLVRTVSSVVVDTTKTDNSESLTVRKKHKCSVGKD